jgi:acyl-CoA thioester hydrolase
MTSSGRSFQYQHRVTYADCTAGNHIYYGRFLPILEAARGAAFRAWGMPFLAFQEQDAIFPVLECLVQYRLPAAYDDLLNINVTLIEASGVRLKFGYRILNQHDRLVLEGHTCHACTTLAGKPKRLPPQILDWARCAPSEGSVS